MSCHSYTHPILSWSLVPFLFTPLFPFPIPVCSTDEDGWYEATLSSGERGLVPCNYIKIVGDGDLSVWPTDSEHH